ncbi:hypothetical protein MIZ01_2363 [Sideroxyarcus emersonii]|uniref:Tetratricopeptide repeat protein n=1 Tax=Sideroxyarcus emersonii TaxID=2764705 RepID=A0AAN1XBZ4_9PROT|nr:tetratricopeptide repeat protein [Sideroxyarcus emersonii]BCK88558.1 hypothetical protein MIZ01_2363 [Sideroxyarcus emersonii]
MSLINQVLNELENRGTTVPLGESTIRPVPPRKRSHLLRYALLALSLLALLAAVMWYSGRTAAPVPEKALAVVPVIAAVPQAVSAPLAPVSAPVETMVNMIGEAASSVPAGMLHGKPLLVVNSEEPAKSTPAADKPRRHRPERVADESAEVAAAAQAADLEGQQIKIVTPQQRAENEFRKANLAVQEGRTNDALAGYEQALLIDPLHKDARLAWAGLLISLKRNDDAEGVLKRGLKRDPRDASFAMLLARLQVERGAVPLALETLQKTLPHAEGLADYQAFVAALLQRQERHDEAIAHYQAALKLVPSNGIWLMGMGISLQALHRNDEARAAYQHALASNSLNAQLQAFVQNKLKSL